MRSKRSQKKNTRYQKKRNDTLRIIQLSNSSAETALPRIQQIEQPSQQNQNPDNPDIEQRQIKNPNMIRKKQRTIFYFLSILPFVLQSAFYVVLFPKSAQPLNSILLFIFTTLSIIFSIINTISLSKFGQVIGYYLMIDNLFIMCMASNLVFAIRQISLPTESEIVTKTYFRVFFFILQSIFISGNFRVVMVYALWNPLKVIIFKLILLMCSIFHIILGLYETISLYDSSSNDNQALINVIIVETCINFTMVLEFFSKVTDVDGTNNLRKDYILVGEQECKQTIRKRILNDGQIIIQTLKIPEQPNKLSSQLMVSNQNLELHKQQKK